MKMAKSFPKVMKNTLGKGEIVRYDKFFLFPHSALKTLLQTCKKSKCCSRSSLNDWNNLNVFKGVDNKKRIYRNVPKGFGKQSTYNIGEIV